MIELIPYKAEHAIEVISQQSKQPCLDVSELTKQWAKTKTCPASTTCVSDGKILGCAGLEICWPGMAEVWALFASDISKYHIIPKMAKQQLESWIKEYDLKRVQAPLRTDFPAGIRFAEFLGFKPDGWPEVPKGVLMKNYHPDGTSAIMYSVTGD